MSGVIEFGNTCACEDHCDGEVCWRPAQRELARRLAAWRAANPSGAYHVSAHSTRRQTTELTWHPERQDLWDLLAPPGGSWQQAYDVRAARVVVRQLLGDGQEEHYIVEPTMAALPLRERRVPALALNIG